MPINARGPDGLTYSPQRDLRQCYPEVIKEALDRFNNHRWGELEHFVIDAGGTWDDLCDAMEAYSRFTTMPIEEPDMTMEQAMRASGWFEQKPVAQIAIMAMLGTVLTGQLHYAVRETTPLGAPPEGMEAVTAQVADLLVLRQRRLAKPQWRQRWTRLDSWLTKLGL